MTTVSLFVPIFYLPTCPSDARKCWISLLLERKGIPGIVMGTYGDVLVEMNGQVRKYWFSGVGTVRILLLVFKAACWKGFRLASTK